MRSFQKLRVLARHTTFQNPTRSRTNVKSHYDVPQEALNVYLDKVYMAYSCGIFDSPHSRDRSELTRIGRGETDQFDSLEKAQWRKFKDAVDFLEADTSDTLLDIGCGYGGQLLVAARHGAGASAIKYWRPVSNPPTC